MTAFCSRIVMLCEDYWGSLAWLLLFCAVFIPMASPVVWPGIPLICLFLIWWIIDSIDQQIPWYLYPLGVIMLLFVFLPRGGAIGCAAWIIYWLRVRE